VIYSNASRQASENGQRIDSTSAVLDAEEYYFPDVTTDHIMKFFAGRGRTGCIVGYTSEEIDLPISETRAARLEVMAVQ